MNKKDDLQKWIHTSHMNLQEYEVIIDGTFNYPPNEYHKAINKIEVTLHHYDDKYSWWKNSVTPESLKEAEHLYKRVKSLHTKLETMGG